MPNKPIILSRDCIRDTYLAKRRAKGKLDGLILSVYNENMRILRSGQLRPYTERKMLANRFLAKQFRKKYPADVVIYVRGGLVQEVRSNDPYLDVTVVDYDERDEDRLDDIEEAEVAEERDNMRVVY